MKRIILVRTGCHGVLNFPCWVLYSMLNILFWPALLEFSFRVRGKGTPKLCLQWDNNVLVSKKHIVAQLASYIFHFWHVLQFISVSLTYFSMQQISGSPYIISRLPHLLFCKCPASLLQKLAMLGQSPLSTNKSFDEIHVYYSVQPWQRISIFWLWTLNSPDSPCPKMKTIVGRIDNTNGLSL